MIKLEDKPQTEMDVIQRTRAIEAIEKSGFQQSDFSMKPTTEHHDDATANDFEFGTAAEKVITSYDSSVTKVIEIDSEGLLHPDWFRDEEERNVKWMKYLTQLRKKIVNSGGK